MTSSTIQSIAVWMILAGLCFAEFVGMDKTGVVLAALGLVVSGAGFLKRYQEWES